MSSEIKVTVKLYGLLRKHRPVNASGVTHQPFELDLQNGDTVAELAAGLGITPGSLSAVAINGEAAGEDTLLQDGDEIRLFPPSAGG